MSIPLQPSDEFVLAPVQPTLPASGSEHNSLLGRVLGPVFSAQTWLALVYLVSGLPLACVALTLTVTGLALGVGLLPVALLGLPVLVLTLVGCGYLGAFERARVELLLGVTIPAPPSAHLPDAEVWQRMWAVLTSTTHWRQAAAALVSLPVAVVGFSAAISVWAAALALVTLPAYNSALPRGGAVVDGTVLAGLPTMLGAALAGVALALLAPHITRGAAAGEVWVDRRLRGPSQRSLETRVGALERSRSRLVGAADAERRRIERDLHDGAQARLVSLAMELGRAKTRFVDDPEAAKELIDQAHEDAKTALIELRNLVRGVHPPVLSDRGLDAALSGLAVLCSVPVSVHVTMANRPSATIEAIAYFVVAETLTNVSKHSGAQSAEVSVRSDSHTLRVVVRDDGRGGANADGAGLAGLADRVQAVDGRLSVTSPLGGPTVVEVELPCES